MTKVEKILIANGVVTTTEGFGVNEVIIAWDEFGMTEEARFKVDVDLSVVFNFLGY